jgi:hypothetical protein
MMMMAAKTAQRAVNLGLLKVKGHQNLTVTQLSCSENDSFAYAIIDSVKAYKRMTCTTKC